jgi:hypothetical protein
LALKPLSPGVSRVQIMPKLNIVFVLLPTEKDFFAADDSGKIN